MLWEPKFFGIKPEVVFKGGFPAWSVMGESNASLMTCEPLLYRPQWGAYGPARQDLVGHVHDAGGDRRRRGRALVAAQAARRDPQTRASLTKRDMLHNDALPRDRGRSGDLPRHGRRRALHVRSGGPGAAGTPLRPQVNGGAPTAVQQAGLLHLAFGRDWRGRSSLRAHRQRFPLRTTQPFYLDPALPEMAFVYVQNPTGGVFAGDRLVVDVVADAGVRRT